MVLGADFWQTRAPCRFRPRRAALPTPLSGRRPKATLPRRLPALIPHHPRRRCHVKWAVRPGRSPRVTETGSATDAASISDDKQRARGGTDTHNGPAAGALMPDRPLSPHVWMYKFKYTLFTSILNRVAGCALTAGLLILVYWLMALASGAESYSKAVVVLSHPLLKLIYVGLAFTFSYHLMAGVRHLVWDTGR